jgi:chromosomal replication initiator protein
MTTLEELAAHYAAVRKRLWMAQPKKAVVIPFPVKKVEEPVVVPERPPTLDELIERAKEKFQPLKKSVVNVIMEDVAKRHNVDVKDMKGKSRKACFVPARSEFAWICVRQRKMSLTKVGQMLGGRDHTTILHAVRQYEKKLAAKEASAPNEGA